MSDQFAPEYIRAIAPYQAGKPISEVAREFGLDENRIIKLASNENPLGMPDSAKKAIANEVGETGRYPDANGFALKKVIGERYGIAQDWITLGNGSNEKAITADTRLLFLANPNNPTGTFLQPSEIEAFLDKVPSSVVVVIDEAYNEYLDSSIQYDSTEWVKKYPNLLVSRTFSKAYGLAGLRVGFGLAHPELTGLLNRVRQPFNVNALAQAAAIAALNDQEFLTKSAKINADGYRFLTRSFEEMGLEYVPSYGNFVLVKVGDDDGAGSRVNLELLKKGIIVRPVNAYGLPKWLRISIGLPEENQAFISALKEVLA